MTSSDLFNLTKASLVVWLDFGSLVVQPDYGNLEVRPDYGSPEVQPSMVVWKFDLTKAGQSDIAKTPIRVTYSDLH